MISFITKIELKKEIIYIVAHNFPLKFRENSNIKYKQGININDIRINKKYLKQLIFLKYNKKTKKIQNKYKIDPIELQTIK